MKRRAGASVGSYLHRVPGAEAPTARVLCFPHAGGGAWSFNHWRSLLPAHVELVKVQFPRERDQDGATPRCVGDLVKLLYAEIESLLDRPLAIYGHSLGALVAFEATRELRRRHTVLPVGLFVSGRRAPHKAPRRVVHELSDEALVEVLKEMGGAPLELLGSEHWRSRYLPMIRSDLRLSDAYEYRPEPPLGCPLRSYLGTDDALIHLGDWEAWSEESRGNFARKLLPGGHFFTSRGEAELVSDIVAIACLRGATGEARGQGSSHQTANRSAFAGIALDAAK